MLEQTVARVAPLILPERILVVAGAAYRESVRRCLPQLPPENFLFEPVGRNTAACVGWAALWVQERAPESVMVVLPADHLIRPEADFLRVIQTAAAAARTSGRLVTIGIRPTHAETGYGYLHMGEDRLAVGGDEVFRVARFVEKPPRETAEQFLADGHYLWNSGIFIWRADSILAELRRHLPQLAEGLEPVRTTIGTGRRADVIAQVYPGLQSISIDVGVMERAQDVWVVPGEFNWSDVGSWRALGDLLPQDASGNVIVGEHRGLDTERCLIYSPHKLVATIGIADLVVIETEDVLLICPKERDQDVRRLVELLEREGRDEVL
jgi:mannose-1-phosphate guanylyltransferase